MNDIEQETFDKAIQSLRNANAELLATKQKLSDFRQEVSDAVCEYKEDQPHIWKQSASGYLSHFIIPKPKPDPLVDIVEWLGGEWTPEEYVKEIRAALEARGLEIREKNDG